MTRIAFIAFQLCKVGGIITQKESLKIGFEKLGHSVTEFFLSNNKQRLPEKNEYDIKNIRGFEKEEWLYDFKNEINQFDLAIFLYPAPHQLKNYNRLGWQRVFEKIEIPMMAIINDP